MNAEVPMVELYDVLHKKLGKLPLMYIAEMLK
jgi:hypothetical protein